MPRQIQKIIQIRKIIQTHQEYTRVETQKNHTNPEIKHRKIIKEYCTKKKKNQSIYIHKPKYPKEKIDLNLKIKSIQSLTKYPQN